MNMIIFTGQQGGGLAAGASGFSVPVLHMAPSQRERTASNCPPSLEIARFFRAPRHTGESVYGDDAKKTTQKWDSRRHLSPPGPYARRAISAHRAVHTGVTYGASLLCLWKTCLEQKQRGSDEGERGVRQVA